MPEAGGGPRRGRTTAGRLLLLLLASGVRGREAKPSCLVLLSKRERKDGGTGVVLVKERSSEMPCLPAAAHAGRSDLQAKA